MARPKDIEDREWLRSGAWSEAGIWLRLEKYMSTEKLAGYSGALTVRDCTRSVNIELDNSNDDDEEALRCIRDYADRALRWIERCRKQMAVEGAGDE